MKVWELSGFGLPNLRMVDREIPKPADHEVLVRVSAVSLNLRDKLLADGTYNPDLEFPMIQASDAVGIVVETGRAVTRVQRGDRVLTNFATRWLDGPPRTVESTYTLGNLISGALAEYIVVSEQIAVKAPAYLTDMEAATLPCAAVTAWYALVEKAKVRAGQTVVVQGTGGVSLFALQIAAALGAQVIVTSSSDEKIERAKRLGAAQSINYVQQPDWDEALLKLTSGEGADVVVEVVGGYNLARSLHAARVGGYVALIGFMDGVEAQIPLLPFVLKQVTLGALTVGPRSAFEAMLHAFEGWELHPVIDGVYSFPDALDAYRHLYRGAFGKVVIGIEPQ